MEKLAAQTGLIGSGSIIGVGGLLYFFLRSQTEDLHEDVALVLRISRLKRRMKKLSYRQNWTIADLFESVARKNKDKEAIYFIDTETSYTYGQVDEISNQIANWAIKEGLKKGEVVALLMDSRPEYVFVWLGLAKAGIITSLINHNLTGRPLLHSLSVCGAKHFIFGIDQAHKFTELGSSRPEGVYYTMGGAMEGLDHIDPQFQIQPTTAPPREVRAGRKADDHLLYIYTSGTTGNPKASIISSLRFLAAGGGFGETFSLKPSDRIYCALPLYHSAGGMVGIGMSWYCGGTFILRGKFSASKFWSDIQMTKATIFQYIGELCRYLLAQPPSPADKSNVRLAIGNGLRPDVWPGFQKRFNVKRIGEFYGATEGNVALLNYPGKVGAIGYISPLFSRFVPLKIVKFDVEKEEIILGADGFCIECETGEPGELISEILDSDPSQKFIGYTDEGATQKKIISNAFRTGDRYFRTGDLIYKDKAGYFFFVDRIGDTFRWKGENVSTGEVALVLGDVPGVKEANVYGVQIPGCDGRAGMATLVVDESVFSLETLSQRIDAELPSYARPLFLRFQKQIEITGTFKHMKYNLQKDGFDPKATSDPIYFRDDSKKTFVRVTEELYEAICSGLYKSRL